jgi:hypothetical protein
VAPLEPLEPLEPNHPAGHAKVYGFPSRDRAQDKNTFLRESPEINSFKVRGTKGKNDGHEKLHSGIEGAG